MGVRTEEGIGELISTTALRAKRVAGNLLDLVLPPMTLDGGARSLSGGLSADTWSRIKFISDPACMGCGQPVPLIADENAQSVLLESCPLSVEGGRNLWQGLPRHQRDQSGWRRHVRHL